MSDGIIRNQQELELTMKADEYKHKLKMEALEYMRTTNKLTHEWEMERFRIRNAEQKKLLQLKATTRHRD